MAENLDPTDVLGVLRDGRPRTKTELAQVTGKVRSTVSLRLSELVSAGLVVELADTATTKGRPSALFALATTSRLICAVELGARHGLTAITDLAGSALAQDGFAIDIADGPIKVLDLVLESLSTLLDRIGRPRGEVIGVGIGVPGPVDPVTGVPSSPPIMPGWDKFDIVAHIQKSFPVPVLVDNDVNVMAIGEWVSVWPDESDLIMVKVATGIGAGIIAGGRLIRGSHGAGGDIGHIQVEAARDRLCRCGQPGCLEAFASGHGIAQTLSSMGIQARNATDVVTLVRGGDPNASSVVRDAGRALGRVLAGLVAALNPSLIILGGEVSQVGEPLLAGIREAVYGRSQPTATNDLRIVSSQNPTLASIVGASRLVQNHLFGLPQSPVVYYGHENHGGSLLQLTSTTSE